MASSETEERSPSNLFRLSAPADLSFSPFEAEFPKQPQPSHLGFTSTTTAHVETGTMSDINLDERGQEKVVDEWKPTKKELFIMMSLSFTSLMVALDTAILVTVLPEIAQKLNGTATQTFWAATSYLLTSVIAQPPIGALSTFFGRQQLLLVSIAFFTVGTLLCANAVSMAMLIVGRCIQGVGGGGVVTLAQIIFCDLIPLRHRPKFFSIVSLAWAIGTIIGPVTGGALIDHATWRWCFHINYPFCGLSFVAVFWVVRMDPVANLTLREKARQMDWIGGFLFMGSMTSFLVGLSWGGIQHPWASGATLAPIIIGLLGVAVFVWWQAYKKENTLLPTSLFNSWSSIAAFYSALINGLTLFAFLYYVPFYEMTVKGGSATRAGVMILPAVACMVPASIVASQLITRTGSYRWAVWSGWVMTTIACALLTIFKLSTSVAVRAVIGSLFGLGGGFVILAVSAGIQAMTKEEDSAMAACMYAFFRCLGFPLGVQLAGTIFQNTVSDKLSSFGLPTIIAHEAESYAIVLRHMPDSPEKIAILLSYLKGLNSIFIMMAAISGSALVTSLLIKKFSMNKPLETKFTARQNAKEGFDRT